MMVDVPEEGRVKDGGEREGEESEGTEGDYEVTEMLACGRQEMRKRQQRCPSERGKEAGSENARELQTYR
jgi:hypothetical protein